MRKMITGEIPVLDDTGQHTESVEIIIDGPEYVFTTFLDELKYSLKRHLGVPLRSIKVQTLGDSADKVEK